MSFRILSKIPILQCLTSFSFESHKVAIKKFIVLWIFASLPVVLAILFSPMSGEADWWVASKLRESISVSEQFVYVASFLTPVLYIWYEKIQAGRPISKGPFVGYGFVALIAVIVMVVTAGAFGLAKNNRESFEATLVYAVLSDYSAAIYIFALYCWYLSLVDGVPAKDYVSEGRREEEAVKSGLAARVANRGIRK